jgi:hypothetical protein
MSGQHRLRQLLPGNADHSDQYGLADLQLFFHIYL